MHAFPDAYETGERLLNLKDDEPFDDPLSVAVVGFPRTAVRIGMALLLIAASLLFAIVCAIYVVAH